MKQRRPWLAGGLAVQTVSKGSDIRVELKLMLRQPEERAVAIWLVGGSWFPTRDEEPYCTSSLQAMVETESLRGRDRLRELFGDVPLHCYSAEFALPKSAITGCKSVWIAFVQDDNERSHDTIRLEISKLDLKASDGLFRLLLTDRGRNQRFAELVDHCGLYRPGKEAALTNLAFELFASKDTVLLTEILNEELEDEITNAA